MTAKELLDQWRTEESEQITPERAKICNEFAVLLEKAINDNDEAEMIAFIGIQNEIGMLNASKIKVLESGNRIGLPEYLEIKSRKSNKQLTPNDVVENYRVFGILVNAALNLTIKDMESEN